MSNEPTITIPTSVLENLLRLVDQKTCTHEEVVRGGAIWTICCTCDEKWADDEGGFKPYVEPEAVTAARACLTHDLVQPQPANVSGAVDTRKAFSESVRFGLTLYPLTIFPRPRQDVLDTLLEYFRQAGLAFEKAILSDELFGDSLFLRLDPNPLKMREADQDAVRGLLDAARSAGNDGAALADAVSILLEQAESLEPDAERIGMMIAEAIDCTAEAASITGIKEAAEAIVASYGPPSARVYTIPVFTHIAHVGVPEEWLLKSDELRRPVIEVM